MVECGQCDHQFEITHDEVIKGKKFYPGEHKDPSLNQFHRAQPAGVSSGSSKAIAAAHKATPHKQMEPTSPVRIVLGLVGGLAMAFMATIMILGASRGGMLDGVTQDKRFIMAGFVAFVGFALIVAANPKAPIRAVLVGLLAAGGLVSIPYYFTEGSVPLGSTNTVPQEPEDQDVKPEPLILPSRPIEEVIGVGPLEAEIQRLALLGSKKRAIGIWFKNMRSSNRYLIRDYILRITNADHQSHFYPRDGDSYLMVVTGITISLDEMKDLMSPLGNVANIYEDLQVIETVVDNDKFQSPSMEVLTDTTNPRFYHFNNEELKSIDLERVSAAVSRLAGAKPAILRADITNRLIYLMEQDWIDFKDDVASALSVWANDPGPASEAALGAAKQMRLDGDAVPLELIQLIVDSGNTDVIPLLNLLWNDNPTKWELVYGEVGPEVEDLMVQNFNEATGVHRDSAVKILGRVGGDFALTRLKTLDESTLDNETKILVKNAVNSINKRLAEP